LAGPRRCRETETSTVVGAYGQTSKNVREYRPLRYVLRVGRQRAGDVDYYQKQLEAMIPAVKIDAGRKAVLVMQKGVEIEGFEAPGDSFVLLIIADALRLKHRLKRMIRIKQWMSTWKPYLSAGTIP
jgi:hypothetical protein